MTPTDNGRYEMRSEPSVQLIEEIGRGTYGTVWKAFLDGKSVVAVKRLNLSRETEGFPFTSVREVKILQSTQHPNIITLESIYNSGGAKGDGDCVDLVFPYMEHDLAGLINNPSIAIELPVAKFYLQQILLGLEYLHNNRIMHRDIKASNILISNSGAVRIADFGLARFADCRQIEYTNRVVTLWYRPPELLFGEQSYDYSIDMWAVGCILIELLTGAHPFPGQTELEMLDRIFRVCGTPTTKSWPEVSHLPWFAQLKPKKPRPNQLRTIYARLPPDALDLLCGLMCLNPKKRLTAAEALRSKFFSTDPLPIEVSDHPHYPQSHEYKARQLRMLKKQESTRSVSAPKPDFSVYSTSGSG